MIALQRDPYPPTLAMGFQNNGNNYADDTQTYTVTEQIYTISGRI